LRYNRTSATYDTTAKITNTSGRFVHAPLQLALAQLSPSTVSLHNRTGLTPDGLPFVSVPLASESLAPGAHVANILLKFRNPSNARITYNSRVRGQRTVLRSPIADPSALGAGSDQLTRFTVYTFGAREAGVSSVFLRIRQGGGFERVLALRDDGIAPDLSRGDGVYGGESTLESAALVPGGLLHAAR
jgi:hypothetical protein